MSAKRAAAGMVFFSPPPPIRIGILRSGGGIQLGQSVLDALEGVDEHRMA